MSKTLGLGFSQFPFFLFFQIVGLFKLFRWFQVELGCAACFELFLVENIIRLLMLLWFSCVVF